MPIANKVFRFLAVLALSMALTVQTASFADAGIFKKTAEYFAARALIHEMEHAAEREAVVAGERLLEKMIANPRLLHNVEQDVVTLAERNPRLAAKIEEIVARATAKGEHGARFPLAGNRYPNVTTHIEEAMESGKPRSLTLSRPSAKPNRAESLKGIETKPKMDRDEYPFAATEEGGSGASVRHLPSGENRGAGSCFGHWCKGRPDGTKFWVDTEDEVVQ